MVCHKLKTYAEVVMFSHTIFSLPFALVSMIWAAQGLPAIETFFWITLAFIGARNGANAFNRLADKDIDEKNPRTANRHLPAGLIKRAEVVGITVFCFALMLLASWMLNPLCVILLPFAILLFVFYSYTKRFTWLCHIVLGIACGGAPVGAWIAVRGTIEWPALILGALVALWVAGFDIIYATQDIDFDRREGLLSIPAVFGMKLSLVLSAFFHMLMIVLLSSLYYLLQLGWIYIIGVGVIAILMILEHCMVSPYEKRNMKIASYSINQVISVIFLVFSVADYVIKSMI